MNVKDGLEKQFTGIFIVLFHMEIDVREELNGILGFILLKLSIVN